MTVTSAVLYYGFIGLAVLVVLWPTLQSGRRFLVRWGVHDPAEDQCALARQYLRDRRLLYPPLFLLAPLLSFPISDAGVFRTLLPLVAALLIAETIAALKPVRGKRIATLQRRRWQDLVPTWAMVLMGALAVIVVLITLIGVLAQPWLDQVAEAIPPDGNWRSADGVATATFSADYLAEIRQPPWLLPFVGLLVGLACSLGVVTLAVRRKSTPDPDVDATLRMRSARVATGIGIAWMCALIIHANNRLGFARSLVLPDPYFPPRPHWLQYTSNIEFLWLVGLLVAAAGWLWVANPPRARQKTAA